jgi:hypothetical protein
MVTFVTYVLQEVIDHDATPVVADQILNLYHDHEDEVVDAEVRKQLTCHVHRLLDERGWHVGTDGITYHHSYDHLTNAQLKQIFVGTLKWGLSGGYVGENAGVFMNDFEAFDGDVVFTNEQIVEFMACPIVRGYARKVALAGRPVHWPQVIALLEEPYQLRYKSMRSQMRDDAETCAADAVVDNVPWRSFTNEELAQVGIVH